MFCYSVIIAEMVSEHRLHGIVSILLYTLFCTLASFHAFSRIKISKIPRNKKFKIKIGPPFHLKHVYQLKLLLIILLKALLIQFSHASIDRHHSFQSFFNTSTGDYYNETYRLYCYFCLTTHFQLSIVSAARTHKQIIMLLLLISGDIHPNPGPNMSHRHTCRLCTACVRVNERVICCDVCDAWFHVNCGRINSTFSRFEGSRVSWICERCDSSNFSQTLFSSSLTIECNNYFSPISNLRQVGCMYSHLDNHQIITDRQHGFRKKYSCTSQLLTLVHSLAESINSKGQTDVIFLDFSKAFDKVSHKKLLIRLQRYGIHGENLSWIKDLLFRRTQKVVMDGEESNACNVLSGVPQGSVLGPVLFLLYINDIITDVDSKINLFADDCALYREIKSAEDASALQNDLDRLYRWSCDWDMDFNVTKCFSMSVTLKRNFIASQYYILDDLIEKVQSHKYLGVYISNDMRWNKTVDLVVGKANRSLGLLRRNFLLAHSK